MLPNNWVEALLRVVLLDCIVLSCHDLHIIRVSIHRWIPLKALDMNYDKNFYFVFLKPDRYFIVPDPSHFSRTVDEVRTPRRRPPGQGLPPPPVAPPDRHPEPPHEAWEPSGKGAQCRVTRQ